MVEKVSCFKKRFRFLNFCLLPVLLLLSMNAVQAQEALIVHKTDGAAAKSFVLDKIQRITFSGNDMSVKQTDGGVAGYALDKIAKLTFGDVIITGISAPPASNQVDVVVYSPAPGEIVVESSAAIRRLALFAIDGKMVYVAAVETGRAPSLQTTVNVSTFPPGVYIFQIETQQGTVVKKITQVSHPLSSHIR